jgi:hypothetical protein
MMNINTTTNVLCEGTQICMQLKSKPVTGNNPETGESIHVLCFSALSNFLTAYLMHLQVPSILHTRKLFPLPTTRGAVVRTWCPPII